LHDRGRTPETRSHKEQKTGEESQDKEERPKQRCPVKKRSLRRHQTKKKRQKTLEGKSPVLFNQNPQDGCQTVASWGVANHEKPRQQKLPRSPDTPEMERDGFPGSPREDPTRPPKKSRKEVQEDEEIATKRTTTHKEERKPAASGWKAPNQPAECPKKEEEPRGNPTRNTVSSGNWTEVRG